MKEIKKLVVPYKCPYNKIKIGQEADGGYVIADIPCEECYSYGSNDEISFEKCMYEKYSCKSYTYDHTIDSITNKPEYISFKRQGVSWYDTSDGVMATIKTHMEEHKSHGKKLLLKMDIESFEWKVFGLCEEDVLKQFEQIVVEFHFYELGYYMIDVLQKLTSHYKIIHMHANQWSINPYLDIEFPKVLEVTFLRNDKFDGVFEVDMDSVFPDPELDAVYAIPFPELKWWKRPYEANGGAQLLKEALPKQDSNTL